MVIRNRGDHDHVLALLSDLMLLNILRPTKKKDKTQPSLKHKHGSDNRENECIKPDVLTSSLH